MRSGVSDITLVDNDVICITNVNRQLQATARNVGRGKADELKALDPDTPSPKTAVPTNRAPNHLDRHHTFDRYVDAKAAAVRTSARSS